MGLCLGLTFAAEAQREATPPTLSTRVEVESGPMDGEAARAALAGAADRVAGCAPEDQRARIPRAGAVFDVRVRANGRTQAVTAREAFDETMRRCLERALFDVRWPRGETGSRFSVRFSPSREEQMLLGALGRPGSFASLEGIGPENVEGAFGGLGLRGTRPGGSGPGGATTGRAQMVPGDTEVRGALPREIIRRVMRHHTGAFRFCYERELRSNPDLAGRVSIRFVIGAEGQVVQAAIADSSLNQSRAEACLVQRVRRISFPQPEGGGVVVVTYPFIFRTTASEPEAEAETP